MRRSWTGGWAANCGSAPPARVTIGVRVAGLHAVTDEETELIRKRLAEGGPLYHARGPGGR
jgi:hypothetical protein